MLYIFFKCFLGTCHKLMMLRKIITTHMQQQMFRHFFKGIVLLNQITLFNVENRLTLVDNRSETWGQCSALDGVFIDSAYFGSLTKSNKVPLPLPPPPPSSLPNLPLRSILGSFQ